MRARCLSLLLSSCVLTFFVSPTWGQENAMPEISFSCLGDRDIPITVAENKAGQTENIFVWQENILAGKTTDNPTKLCHDVAHRLNEFQDKRGDEANSSSFYLSAQQYSGIPIICISYSRGCEQVLFTLNRNGEERTVGERVLNSIVAPNIRKSFLNARSANFRAYKVNLFSDE